MRSSKQKLPEGWAFATLSNMVDDGGVLTDGDWVESKDQDVNGDVRLIQLADVGDGYYRDRSNRFMTYERAVELNCTFLKPDDVLIARMPDPLGRACIFPGDNKKSVTVVDVCIVRTGKTEIGHGYIMHVINLFQTRQKIEKLQRGTTRKRISRKNLISIELPFPPLSEQERIVDVAEKLFVRVSNAKDRLEKAADTMKRFRRSILNAACIGQLTEDWREKHPDVEPAGSLLKKVKKEHQLLWEEIESSKMLARNKVPDNDKWKLKYSYPKYTKYDQLPEIPEAWVWCTLEQLAIYKSGVAYKSKDFSKKGIQVVKLGNLYQGRFDLTRDSTFLPANHPDIKMGEILGGDILVSQTGTRHKRDYGFFVVLPYESPKLVLNQRLLAIRAVQSISNKWLLFSSYQDYYRNHFFSHETGGVNQGNVGVAGVMKGPVSLPPAKEQQEIVRRVEKLFKLADKIEERLSQARERVEKLTQSILAKAFRGKLVPTEAELAKIEGRDYETAEQLLERIQAERKAKPKAKKKRIIELEVKSITVEPMLKAEITVTRLKLLLEIITESKKGIKPEDLLYASKYSVETIEDFYEELAKLEKQGKIEDYRPNNRVSILRIKK